MQKNARYSNGVRQNGRSSSAPPSNTGSVEESGNTSSAEGGSTTTTSSLARSIFQAFRLVKYLSFLC